MNHKIYEEWLVSNEELSPKDAATLREHLQYCESCSRLAIAWKEVDHRLADAPLVSPKSNFVDRWRVYLEADQQKRLRRQNSLMLFGTWTITGGILITLVVVAWPILRSPKILLLAYLYQFVSLFKLINLMQDMIAIMSRSLSVSNALGWLVLLTGVFSALSVFWFISIRYLMSPRRLSK
jgi:hypothetical protein